MNNIYYLVDPNVCTHPSPDIHVLRQKLLRYIVQEKADFFHAGQHASLQVQCHASFQVQPCSYTIVVVQEEDDLRDCEERSDAPIDKQQMWL